MKKNIIAAGLFLLLILCSACAADARTEEIAKTALDTADRYLEAEITLQAAYAQISQCLTEAKACAKADSNKDTLVVAGLAGLKDYFSCVEKGINCYNSYEITQARNQLAKVLGEALLEEYVKSK